MNLVFDLMLEKLVITQKTYGIERSLNTLNKLVFIAKTSISKFSLFALFNLLNLKVQKINSMNYNPENIVFRGKKGKTKKYKKIIVTFDRSIDISKVIQDIVSLQLIAVNKEVL